MEAVAAVQCIYKALKNKFGEKRAESYPILAG